MAKYVLFDTETTGASEEDRIIQIGSMIIDIKEPIEVYDELCSCEIPIKLEAMEVHNITPDLLENKHILLIDDVITTGATIEACVNMLKKIKNVKISIVSIAAASK